MHAENVRVYHGFENGGSVKLSKHVHVKLLM